MKLPKIHRAIHLKCMRSDNGAHKAAKPAVCKTVKIKPKSRSKCPDQVLSPAPNSTSLCPGNRTPSTEATTNKAVPTAGPKLLNKSRCRGIAAAAMYRNMHTMYLGITMQAEHLGHQSVGSRYSPPMPQRFPRHGGTSTKAAKSKSNGVARPTPSRWAPMRITLAARMQSKNHLWTVSAWNIQSLTGSGRKRETTMGPAPM
mmetsp:Transcript_8547/g.24581  ORF Transcript_8547/g.24581 Transcript_8547/m.24581 type:complete len:201 (-) Transcript_8547:2030-2632(-)